MSATRIRRFLSLTLVLCALASTAAAAASNTSAAPPTPDDARKFIEAAEVELLDLWIGAERAAWVQANFITDDTERIAAAARKAVIAATMRLASQSTRYDGLALPGDVARKIKLLKVSLALVAPSDPAKQAELSQIAASLEGAYGKGQYCPPGKECMDLTAIEDRMAASRDTKELLDLWTGWHAVGRPLRPRYERFVTLANEGARELGFADLGALWRSGYDMPPDEFAREVDRLWEQVKPLYESLHCYVRSRLQEKYGKDLVPDGAPIPAHLLGNMWAQEWGNVYDLVKPAKDSSGLDVTALLRAKKMDEREMVRYGERFFESLGFDPLPKTFWERSLFTKPHDRDVVCHASAWDIDWKDDLRLKMCIQINATDFSTIHHELGHNYYQRAYNRQPPLFANGAHDGFHEAIGDAVALSITPEYLVRVGLLEKNKVPPPGADIGLLLRQALDKVAFLPFGMVVDRWRWNVFAGSTSPASYNDAWWALRRKYQGVAPPVTRTESDFDPGAKYHVPANTPYARYFLAGIMQYQFDRALCREAGHSGPLHRCSIYGNQEVGRKFIRMLEMGQSRPWPEALSALTGETRMDATALLDYFAPLKKWLDEQNRGKICGW